MSDAYNKLIKTLQTIFEMDKADLDFGIYRILNQKRDEINAFLENDLLPQVKEAFSDYATGSQSELKKELQATIEQAREFGAQDPDNAPAVLKIKEKMASSVDITAVENEVYSHLHTFFSRYYNKGDFISQRRYKSDTYAIPYEGEEVKLYWANHDQYYIKSSEHLRDYTFNVETDSEKSVRIKLVEADTEKDNVKAKSGEERRFVLDEETPLSVEDGELHIHFQYIPVGKKKQETLNKDAVEKIFKREGFAEWLDLLKIKAPTEKNPNRTLLEKHLNDYTARNTFDYFIHKDLGSFLRRELDFYIKNEVMHLDDIDDADFKVTDQHLRKIKIIRTIAHKFIRMLAQLEDFQKKLWLKKKFVVETNYCITLDKVPEELYEEVISCDHQWKMWESMFLVADIDSGKRSEVIRKNNYLMIDTKYFSQEFKETLLGSIENVSDAIDGVLINSENFQAANLVGASYDGRVDLVYLDPPYNTDATPIVYKNGYKESSWASLMLDRIRQSGRLLKSDGAISVAIDDTEAATLKQIIKGLFPGKDIFQCVVEHYPGSGTGRSNVSRTHEYCLFAVDSDQDVLRGESVDDGERVRGFRRAGTGDNNFRRGNPGRPESFYAVLVDSNSFEVMGAEPPPSLDADYPSEDTEEGYKRVYPIGVDGSERVWTLSYVGVMAAIEEKRIICSDNFIIKRIYHDKERRLLLPSLWQGSEYNATSNGTNLLTDIFGEAGLFSYPKALGTIKRVIESIAFVRPNAIIFDSFGGSGTTAHAVIERNRNENKNNKYVLIEMGLHSASLIKERIIKVVFSRKWKSGAPDDKEGVPHFLKYMSLESYEDALNNLVISSRSIQQQDLIEGHADLREDYMLGYWLDVETADSASLLNIDQFEDPFNYTLNISTDSVGVSKSTRVDLVETFNYLLGLTVSHFDTVRSFKVVMGANSKDESVLVVWRNLKEKDNAALEDFLDKSGYNPKDTEYDHIYVNGDHTLEDPRSKVKMIEIEFKRLMFDVQDV